MRDPDYIRSIFVPPDHTNFTASRHQDVETADSMKKKDKNILQALHIIRKTS